MGISLTPEEQFEIFGSNKFSGEHADEARERWGDTEAWKESNRRTTGYTKADWQRIRAEAEEIVAAFAAELRAGTVASAPAVRAIAERHRGHLGRWFYECSRSFHRNLGEMYVADERFRRNYDKVAPGLAEYVRAAIVANADGAVS
jgi:hypothetical protein